MLDRWGITSNLLQNYHRKGQGNFRHQQWEEPTSARFVSRAMIDSIRPFSFIVEIDGIRVNGIFFPVTIGRERITKIMVRRFDRMYWW
mmetsp:Transcript_14842/g.41327  ORF Transcript_14842/g.41327 Transcript_14842/m.41327 type:complete len:88 (-) Transcript_14842:282-545(-)